jgi:hypothetical protein
LPERKIRITAGAVRCVAQLLDNLTANAIWDALPLEARANRWGDELYFSVSVQLDEDAAREEVAIGDVAYWAPGRAVCIFWGPTPASHDREPRAASPVNVFGRVVEGASDFGSVASGAVVRLDQA